MDKYFDPSPENSLETFSIRLRASLPFFPTPLIGRTYEQVQLRAFILDPHIRLLTLMGMGGVGKTRLAVAVAQTLHEEGIVESAFVSLAAVRDPAQVLPSIAQALGVYWQNELTLASFFYFFSARTPSCFYLTTLSRCVLGPLYSSICFLLALLSPS